MLCRRPAYLFLVLIGRSVPTDTHAKPRSTASVESYRAHRLGGFTKTAFPLSRHRLFRVKWCVAALSGVFGAVLSAAEVVFVRVTGYSLEKGVSLHECTGKRVFPFATQVISRKMVCRGGCEVRKGKERKGSGSGWDGRAVECRKETAPGLCHGCWGEGQNKNRSQGNLKPVLICLRV